ncbi:VOC family protein [Streptacidiphilus sp. PB12-B1b]|uniref:VOC family protein n=1 Tax=Streptacidiphilus sp. PB12-B1b TaxID=2705012 RepID=UPI0015FAD2C5|nr:VOC family protein [Streptacidiphilus sp. PB12-B1b]QMU76993.1 VOC family protein [Streptacidiphilus sp. PB12-B1b]
MDTRSGTGTLRVPCLPGAPSWVSLLAHDPVAARSFYGPLLGWSFERVRAERTYYAVASVQGVQVAGISSLPSRGHFSATWTTFFGVTDVDAAARRVPERMGTVGVGPMGAWAGRIAIATDPEGAIFGLWQGPVGPARRLPLLGAPSWIELSTDAFAAALFYGSVLDWAAYEPEHLDMAWEHERVVLRVEGRRLAALRTADLFASAVPVRPHWHVSFSVDDLEHAIIHALRLGGVLVSEPVSTPYGRTAALYDPEGAAFSLVSPIPDGSDRTGKAS